MRQLAFAQNTSGMQCHLGKSKERFNIFCVMGNRYGRSGQEVGRQGFLWAMVWIMILNAWNWSTLQLK